MRINKYFIYLTVAVFGLDSCKKSNPAPVNAGPDIYVAGYANFNTGGGVAIYWKNNVAHLLTHNSISSTAADMVLNDTDVYVVGTSNISYLNAATYWKNGVPVTFGDNNGASSIAVADGDVYVAFTGASAQGFGQPYYWKNGVFNPLTNGSSEAESEGMILNGTDVYITGYTTPYGGPAATYWKNGALTMLENNSLEASIARSIYINGSDVYITGFIQTQNGYDAVYWKNGTRVTLAVGLQDADAYAIAVQNNDVYVAGTLNQKGTYWKNGVPTTLGNGTLNSIAISGSDIYFAGTDNGQACYWKNGNEVKLPGVIGYPGFSRAVKIVVVPH